MQITRKANQFVTFGELSRLHNPDAYSTLRSSLINISAFATQKQV